MLKFFFVGWGFAEFSFTLRILTQILDCVVVRKFTQICKTVAMKIAMKNVFVHHVYFWLKNAGNEQQLAELVAGLKKLSAVATIKEFHIGLPASTSRDVIDGSYAVSWLLLFDNQADQDSYQLDPMHLKFIEECSVLWQKVVVYDSVDAH